MEEYSIEGTLRTPSVHFNFQKGLLVIKGRSIPEDPTAYYQPVVDILNDYSKVAQPETTFIIHLEYFNTSSSRCLFGLFKQFEKINEAGSNVTVYWHYDQNDEDMLESGEDFHALLNLPFVFTVDNTR